MDQNPLVRLKIGARDQALVGGQESNRHGGCVLDGELRRQRGDMILVDNDVSAERASSTGRPPRRQPVSARLTTRRGPRDLRIRSQASARRDRPQASHREGSTTPTSRLGNSGPWRLDFDFHFVRVRSPPFDTVSRQVGPVLPLGSFRAGSRGRPELVLASSALPGHAVSQHTNAHPRRSLDQSPFIREDQRRKAFRRFRRKSAISTRRKSID